MDVTLIVCTRNRADKLPALIDSVAAATLPDGMTAELLVVDNGSTDGTAALVAARPTAGSLPVRCVAEPVPGLSAARNRGLAEARGAIIAFTDDDCRLATDYFERLGEVFAETDRPSMIGGRVLLFDETAPKITVKYTTERQEARRAADLHRLLHGCNMAAHRAVFDAVGPFDTRLGAGTALKAGEDTDFLFRAWRLDGTRIAYDPRPVVYHDHDRLDDAATDTLLAGYKLGLGAFYAKHLAAGHLAVLGVAAKQLRPPVRRMLFDPDRGRWRRQFALNRLVVTGARAWLRSGRMADGRGSDGPTATPIGQSP
ncbi:MAG: glycosyltransferase, partial [Alphaproteobacteria bacterium]|nr:glycosyltransferase [Alphaproteobacteria bacterium]